jgi:gas vesicle protein
MESIECPVCTESFNRSNRIPLVLLCGHSICKKCTVELLDYKKTIICPLDRKVDTRPINQVSFSYTILELIDHVSSMTAKIKFLSLTPQARIEAVKDDAEKKISKIDENIEKINNRIAEVQTMKTDILQEIDGAFLKLTNALSEQKDNLKTSVDSITEEYFNKYYEVMQDLEEMKKEAEEQLGELTESSQNSIYELSISQIPEIPEQNLKLKFTEDSDKLISLIKHYGRVRNMTTSVPYNCDHFTNITYWMVPPCCYQYYCCNKCHDKKETHAWTYANRMVCMYCEKEQDYRKLPNICEQCSMIHKGVISRN